MLRLEIVVRQRPPPPPQQPRETSIPHITIPFSTSSTEKSQPNKKRLLQSHPPPPPPLSPSLRGANVAMGTRVQERPASWTTPLVHPNVSPVRVETPTCWYAHLQPQNDDDDDDDDHVFIKDRKRCLVELGPRSKKCKRRLVDSGGLPSGWSRCVDEVTGRPYYYNETTGETTWKRPAVEKPETCIAAASHDRAAGPLGNHATTPVPALITIPASRGLFSPVTLSKATRTKTPRRRAPSFFRPEVDRGWEGEESPRQAFQTNSNPTGGKFSVSDVEESTIEMFLDYIMIQKHPHSAPSCVGAKVSEVEEVTQETFHQSLFNIGKKE
mmetsp:Transcript_6887/g.19287  ORF Transcript_6887/g.19287 Transcript_6887/m.19287 type:complete len:326 (+) Transcript_6887:1165-2142(+)